MQVNLSAKPTPSSYVRLVFKGATFLGCTPSAFIEAVNDKVKNCGAPWTLTTPAIQAYNADIYGARDAQYCDVTVRMFSFDTGATWGTILKPVQSFHDDWFACFSLNGNGITLDDVVVIQDIQNQPPSTALTKATATTALSQNQRTTAAATSPLLHGFDAVKWIGIGVAVVGVGYLVHATGFRFPKMKK